MSINLKNMIIKNFKFDRIHQLRQYSKLLFSQAHINGRWVDASSGEYFEVRNPANHELIGHVPNMNVDDVKCAIKVAKNAFYDVSWRKLTARERSQILRNWHTLIQANAQGLAELITAESGKPITEAKAEVSYGNSFVEWFSEEAPRIYGEIIPSSQANREIMITKQPLGVAALITAWNFPMALLTRKAAAALAAGCTLVAKPAEDTPLTALALAKLATEAGLPAGVFNVITCDRATAPTIGDLFCRSPDVRGISFTGSTQVGKILYSKSGDGIKRVSLELGGNAPFIVFDSADLDKAVDGAIASKFRNCGQTCVAANRFFVQQGIYDCFLKALQERVESLKIGFGSNVDCQIGPLINKLQLNKVSSYVENALCNGAKLLTGGCVLHNYGELFYAPTILTEVNNSAKLYWEEVFGPVVSIIKFKHEDEAICCANETLRGLAGYFYSTDLQQVFRVARLLQVGMVGVNAGMISTAEAPFGGVDESGIGREGSHYGINEFVEIKYICIGELKF